MLYRKYLVMTESQVASTRDGAAYEDKWEAEHAAEQLAKTALEPVYVFESVTAFTRIMAAPSREYLYSAPAAEEPDPLPTPINAVEAVN